MVRCNLTLIMLVGIAMPIGACRPPEPLPSHNTDVGTEGEILLPTPAAWHDEGIVKGQAEWKPFRKPSAVAAAEASSEGAAAPVGSATTNGAVEKEIRDLVDEFNGLVKEGKYTEALDFLTDEQAVIVEQAVEQIPKFAQTLKELAEVAPGCREHVNRALPTISAPNFLVFGASDLKIASEREATGIVGDPKTHRPFLDIEPFKVRFIRDNDGYWLIESGHIANLPEMISAMRGSMEGLTSFVDAIKSGTVADSDVDSGCEGMNRLLDKLTRLLGESIPVAPESSGAPTIEKPDSELPAVEPPPEPKKPATGG